MEDLNVLEEKIVNDYVDSIIKHINGKFLCMNIEINFSIKAQIMNIISKNISTNGSVENLRFSINLNVREELKDICKEVAIETFVNKLNSPA